jgi:DNA-binding transcriptional MerR regulator
MRHTAMRVGELARRTGLTIRTLHHYDEIGLLSPSVRGESGHRLYTEADIARLQRIVSLRQLGFSLDEVRACLDRADFSPHRVIELHLARLREQITMQTRLSERLEGLAKHLRDAAEVSADYFLNAIEGMTMIEQYYTPERLEYLQKRREEMGPEADKIAAKGTQDWSDLLADYKAEMDKGTDPADPRLQELEKRRQALVSAFSGGNAGIEESLKRMWTEQGDKLCATFGMDPKVVEYLGKVVVAQTKS